MNYPKDKEPDSLVCPNCGSNQWYEGPSGGMATNIKCGGCGLWFNNTPFGLDFIGIKGNIGEEKKIVWYCAECKEVTSVVDNKALSTELPSFGLGKYPHCRCGSLLKVCWSYEDFPKKYCETCGVRFKCYTTRGNF